METGKGGPQRWDDSRRGTDVLPSSRTSNGQAKIWSPTRPFKSMEVQGMNSSVRNDR